MDTPGLWEPHGDPGMGVHRLLSWSQSPQAMVRVTDFTDRRNLQSLLLENSSRTTKLAPKYKQPNLSFPTWRECYSAAATHNKEIGAVPTLTFPTPAIILLHFYVLYVCTFSIRDSLAGSRATLWGHLGPCSWFHSPCCCGAASLPALQWVRSCISPFWRNQHISPLPALGLGFLQTTPGTSSSAAHKSGPDSPWFAPDYTSIRKESHPEPLHH